MAGESRTSAYSGIKKSVASIAFSAIYYFNDRKR
jgi:hypothetical protein